MQIQAATRLRASEDYDYDAEYDKKADWKLDVEAAEYTIKPDKSNAKNLLAYKGKILKGRWNDSKKHGWLNE